MHVTEMLGEMLGGGVGVVLFLFFFNEMIHCSPEYLKCKNRH